MKVGIVQINTTVGDLVGNEQKLLAGVARAAEQGAKLVVAPELCVPGYPPLDLLERPSFVDACERAEARIVEAIPEGVTVVFGNVRRRPIPPTYGRALQNVAVVATKGRVIRHVVKTLLPTYDVFDEARFFEPRRDSEPNIVEVEGQRVGVTVCEDMWNDDELWKRVDLWRLRESFLQLVDGLEALHTLGKLHRDIKPSNVLVTDAGRVVLLDFGLAKWLPASQRVPSMEGNMIFGKVRYMPPEQLKGHFILSLIHI